MKNKSLVVRFKSTGSNPWAKAAEFNPERTKFYRGSVSRLPEFQIKPSARRPQFFQEKPIHPDSPEEILDQHVLVGGVDTGVRICKAEEVGVDA